MPKDTTTMDAMASNLESTKVEALTPRSITRSAKYRYLKLATKTVECLKVKDVPFVVMAVAEPSVGDRHESNRLVIEERVQNDMAYIATLAERLIDDLTRLEQLHLARSEEILDE